MAARIPIPEELRDRAFSIAEGNAAGLTKKALARQSLARPYRGVRATEPALTSREQVLRFGPRLRGGQALSGPSALRVYGLPVPRRHRSETVDVLARQSASRPRAAGVRARRIRDDLWEADLIEGVRVVPVPLLFTLLASSFSETELVTVGDAMISDFDRYPGRVSSGSLTQLTCLEDAVERWGRLRGCSVLRGALPRLREHVASPPESWLRCLIVDAGIEEPAVNADIHAGGRFLARGDLVFRAQRVVVEYEGEVHLSPAQFRRDITRTEALIAAGWRVIRVTHADLFPDAAAFLARLRAALSR
ncbi:endonuclease domain-containing protein [Pseudoclavibacter sp. VKM Ac-2888]|uniref:endonuclease domain-containing protein n=1 Tax=Pseudoclavibacter sp. VKM Ac-2888 TaxID=2783830 RepID=UPI00188BC79E|nr:DUF559 domain-containing protein [Pseudoclavibacter sp. VKM Ac-2888]MBF4549899.1 DUF559 domain-containing protein [Pseudoclavibacter sp. VKM Ac-2888]